MSARTKLNTAYALGSVVIAGLVGMLFQSWAVFLVAATVLVAVCLLDGTIRPPKRK